MTATLVATRTYQRCADKNQRDELITSHLWLVRHIVRRLAMHLPGGVDLENLESAGVLGLLEATNKYDPTMGTKFKTYAYTRIRGAILDELRRNSPLPQHMMEQVAKVNAAYKKLQSGTVTLEALAEETGLSVDEVADCLSAMRLTKMLSWESENHSWENSVLSTKDLPDDVAEEKERLDLLREGIEALNERERLAVTLYYLEDLRLKEIGELLGLSESRVSRVLSTALFRLREYIRVREGEEIEELTI
ncbi:MAG: RNA polymerase sigma factor [Gemmatales bacterium]|nr:MAG: RNA polymerase sigma factor [Gemmatales bacterium]